jgi:aldehyde dehydrogenase (NAD+)
MRVASIAIANMRSPFLATEIGIATAMTKIFRHEERKSICARTMVVTSNIELDRMLLHSRATSTVKSGMCSSIPRCSTGTPAAMKRKRAEAAEPCCSRLTTGFSTKSGKGTIQNKKQRGKRARWKAAVPKQRITAAIHHRTSDSMLSESCTSGVRVLALDLTRKVIKAAMTSRTDPSFTLDPAKGAGDFQSGFLSKKIRTRLTGRISRMCVYCSSVRAKLNEEVRGPHQIARETATRMPKTRSGDKLAFDSRPVLPGTMSCLKSHSPKVIPRTTATALWYVREGTRRTCANNRGSIRVGTGLLISCSSEFRQSNRRECMKDCRKFYIDGKWVNPAKARDFEVINPASEEPIATISLGSASDVDKAVAAAKKAFESYSETTVEERLALLRRIIEVYKAKSEEMAETISQEMGAPISLSRAAQAPAGLGHLFEIVKVLEHFKFEELKGSTLMRKEPIGVCGLITPWNWPMNQIAAKVAPALAAGCTVVLKPSEMAPLSAYLFAQILDQAELPPGVFNLVNGDGPTVGSAISSHPDIDMVSFTGSTRGGVAVATAAAPSVKRVTQELGGKSAHIILEDADLGSAVKEGVQSCFRNTGQSCNAPTRMLVPRSRMAEAAAVAKQTAEATKVGDPFAEGTHIGPLASKAQFDKVERLINAGVAEGAKLVVGGPGRPEGIKKGYFVKPTVFTDVSNDMTIAREEIFGPVLCMIPYGDENEAVRIANDTPYGLSAYVSSGNLEHAHRVAKQIRSGNVHINNARIDFASCFGGYKQSGNGREWGEAGLEEFLELKAIFGYESRAK